MYSWIMIINLWMAIMSQPILSVPSQTVCDANTDYRIMALELHAQQAYEAVIPLAECWLQADPNNTEALMILSSAYSSTRRYAQALEVANRWVMIEPEGVLALTERAKAYLGLKEYTACRDDLDGVLTMDSTYHFAIGLMAVCEYHLGNFTQTIALTEMLVPLYEEDYGGINTYFETYRAAAYYRMGWYAQASDVIDRVLSVSEQNFFAQIIRIATDIRWGE